ncbi:hypothetical protein EDB89DRAFT_989126 [Lactarius sanguifluus]|nr:hypothetical protein EDB89DRAFT_989126 [Lactarius sanguifluus]
MMRMTSDFFFVFVFIHLLCCGFAGYISPRLPHFIIRMTVEERTAPSPIYISLSSSSHIFMGQNIPQGNREPYASRLVGLLRGTDLYSDDVR